MTTLGEIALSPAKTQAENASLSTAPPGVARPLPKKAAVTLPPELLVHVLRHFWPPRSPASSMESYLREPVPRSGFSSLAPVRLASRALAAAVDEVAPEMGQRAASRLLTRYLATDQTLALDTVQTKILARATVLNVQVGPSQRTRAPSWDMRCRAAQEKLATALTLTPKAHNVTISAFAPDAPWLGIFLAPLRHQLTHVAYPTHLDQQAALHLRFDLYPALTHLQVTAFETTSPEGRILPPTLELLHAKYCVGNSIVARLGAADVSKLRAVVFSESHWVNVPGGPLPNARPAHLTRLDFTDNENFTDRLLDGLCLQNLPALQDLGLGGTDVSLAAIDRVFPRRNLQMRKFTLTASARGEANQASPARLFGKLPALQSLEWTSAGLTGAQFAASGIQGLQELTRLRLTGNALHRDARPIELRFWPKLRYANFVGNELDDVDIAQLEVAGAPYLHTLSIGANEFTTLEPLLAKMAAAGTGWHVLHY